MNQKLFNTHNSSADSQVFQVFQNPLQNIEFLDEIQNPVYETLEMKTAAGSKNTTFSRLDDLRDRQLIASLDEY